MEAGVRLGISADRMSYGHTIKKESDIEKAHAAGIDLFAFDSAAEMEGKAGPRRQPRFLPPGDERRRRGLASQRNSAARSKSPKICSPAPRTVAFSPTVFPSMSARSRRTPSNGMPRLPKRPRSSTLDRKGVSLELINLGGGLPARYLNNVPTTAHYGDAIMTAMHKHFGNQMPKNDTGAGPGLVGDAGVIQAEVVLIAERHVAQLGRALQWHCRRRATARRCRASSRGRVAKNSTWYEHTPYQLPKDLKVGDRIELQSAGAYWSYAVCFNGIPPLKQHVI